MSEQEWGHGTDGFGRPCVGSPGRGGFTLVTERDARSLADYLNDLERRLREAEAELRTQAARYREALEYYAEVCSDPGKALDALREDGASSTAGSKEP